MNKKIREKVAKFLGEDIQQVVPLGGGCIGSAYLIKGGTKCVVAKTTPNCDMKIEYFMLNYLKEKSSLPVPSPLFASKDILIMEYVQGDGRRNKETEIHAAHLIYNMHKIQENFYGFSQDTVIGAISQPNKPTDNWSDFFANQRLYYTADLAYKRGKISKRDFTRVKFLIKRISELIPSNPPSSLLHGDIWVGNIIFNSNKIVAFIDPAIYYGHFEVELAFIKWLGAFGSDFFAEYDSLTRIDPQFYSTRIKVYTLYPILVHIYFFGGSYVAQLLNILASLGF